MVNGTALHQKNGADGNSGPVRNRVCPAFGYGCVYTVIESVFPVPVQAVKLPRRVELPEPVLPQRLIKHNGHGIGQIQGTDFVKLDEYRME